MMQLYALQILAHDGSSGELGSGFGVMETVLMQCI